MQRIILFLFILSLSLAVNATVTTNITLASAGTLKDQMTSSILSTTTDLIVSGPIDARDFLTMRASMTALLSIDLSNANIQAYTGSDGTNGALTTYTANEIPIYAFVNESNLTTVKLPNSATSIAESAFNNCTGLSQITLSSSISNIGNYAFNKCSSLTSIFIPASVNAIGNQVFQDCSAYFTVDNNNVTYSSLNGILYNKAQTILKQCPTSLTGSIVLPSTTTTIETYAFNYCTSLTQITIPASVSSIATYAFRGCTALLVVNAGNANFSSLNGILYNAAKTKLIQCPTSISGTVAIPASVTTIDFQAFYDCKLISQVTMPAVKIISGSAFYNCKALTQLSLPSSITSIGTSAFSNCTALSSIYAYWTTPISLTASSVFANVNKGTCTLHVPIGSVANYEAATYWTDFINIVEFDSTPVEDFDRTEFTLFPNPAKTYFTVTTDKPSELTIIALSGVEVHKQFVYNNDRVDISHLKQGIYLANMNNHCIKLVKRF